MSDPLLIERRGTVAIVTLNLPQKRNALSLELFLLLAKLLNELQDDKSVRALVLYGGRYFCAGGDLSSFEAAPLAMRGLLQVGQRTVRALIGGRLPAVAAVEGSAYGAGFSLALACDFVVADSQAVFCAAFGRVGLAPDMGLLWTLPQRVGVARAREILMFCEEINGVRAHAMGLVDRLVESGQVLESAIALAERLAMAPPGTIATTKSVLSRAPLSLEVALEWEADTQAMLVCTEDVGEGIKAFLQKRKPEFKGR